MRSDIKSHILYEDNHYLIVNKPAGVLSQGDQTGDDTILDEYKEYIREKYDKPGAVFLAAAHRLDRPVSGCLILGRTSKGLSRMTRLFADRQVHKVYLALTDRQPSQSSATLTDYLLKDTRRNTTRVVSSQTTRAKKAVLNYRVLGQTSQGCWLIHVEPQTGRSHQIRVQLSHAGMPLVGDHRYGSDIQVSDKSIGLHSWQIGCEHPVRREPLRAMAPLPKVNIWHGANDLLSSES